MLRNIIEMPSSTRRMCGLEHIQYLLLYSLQLYFFFIFLFLQILIENKNLFSLHIITETFISPFFSKPFLICLHSTQTKSNDEKETIFVSCHISYHVDFQTHPWVAFNTNEFTCKQLCEFFGLISFTFWELMNHNTYFKKSITLGY